MNLERVSTEEERIKLLFGRTFMEHNKFWTRLSIVSLILTLVLIIGTVWLWRENTSLKTEMEAVKVSNMQAVTKNTQLESDISSLKQDVKGIEDKNTSGDTKPTTNANSVPDKTLYYISKLGDKTFTTTYNHDYTWYIAAEELGKIGKDAIPLLIENLNTGDVYEKSLTFYALQLASQNDNVKSFTKGEYINVKSPLAFDGKDFDEMTKIVNAWWQKYKNNFN